MKMFRFIIVIIACVNAHQLLALLKSETSKQIFHNGTNARTDFIVTRESKAPYSGSNPAIDLAFQMVSEAPQGCPIYEAFTVWPGGSETKEIPISDCGIKEINVKVYTPSGIIDAQKYGGPKHYIAGSGNWIVVGKDKNYFVSRIAQ